MKYIGKKVITMLFTLLIVSLLVFFAFDYISGDPATSMLGMDATPQKVAALREELGLNQPVIVRYLNWIGGFFQGDFGTSYSYKIPVMEMIGDKLPITITLAI
ncbi:MAG: ABC transporter permease, partial [Clostridiales bacterium]|nr:ABC transporter permease [Clostridiales bacterium]